MVVKPPLLESLLAVDFLSILIEYLKQQWNMWLKSKDNQVVDFFFTLKWIGQ